MTKCYDLRPYVYIILINTSIFWDLKQFRCQASHSGIYLRSSAVLVRLVLHVPLQQNLELLKLLRDISRASRVELAARGPEPLEILVIPVQSFPCQANLRDISRFQFVVRIIVSQFWRFLASWSQLVNNSIWYGSWTSLYGSQWLCKPN